MTYVIGFILTVGILVVFHELGHYLAARLMGVKILRFSVGFGRTIWSRRFGRDQTEWAISAVPLGGYVKMVDEREGDVSPTDRPRAFNRQSVGTRSFIVVAGPLANFLLAWLLYWVLLMTGMPGDKPVVATPAANTPAAAAQLKDGDILRAIGGDPMQTWADVRMRMLEEASRRGSVEIDVESQGGSHAVRTLDLSSITRDDLDKDLLGKIGLRQFRPFVPAVLGEFTANSPALRAGLAEGDRIVSIDGNAIQSWYDFTSTIQKNPGKELVFAVDRGGNALTVKATPDLVTEGRVKYGRLGVKLPSRYQEEFRQFTVTVRYGPIEATIKAARKVVDLSMFSLKMLGRMIMGDVSWKNLSGPITIADFAGQSVQLGWITFVGFLALVSVSLGILNLLPIPLLDGGHLVYYFAEIVKGSPVSEKTMEIGQRLGLALLLGLTFFAFYNDLNRLFTG